MKLKDIWYKYWTDKFEHWFLDLYEWILTKYWPNIMQMLEIWVYNGASLRMWRDYMPNVTIIWVDINPALDIPWVIEYRADATTQEFADKMEFLDLIIDDWSHLSSHQIKSLELLWPKLNAGGIYILEDIHTSLRDNYKDTDVSALDHFKKFAQENCEAPCIEYRKDETQMDGTLILFKDK